MKKIIKPSIFIVLNLSSLAVLLWSLMIYTSLFKGIPWYEPCGMQFLAILILSDPVFLILGIALFILGKFIPISLINKSLPLMAIAGLSLPILIGGGLSKTTLLIGTTIGMIILVLTIVSTVKDFISQNKNLTRQSS